MTFDEIQARARTLTAAEIEAELRSLGTDPRLAAVLAKLEQHVGGFVAGTCVQKLAADPGKQSHGLGSIFALLEFRAVLTEACGPRRQPVKPGGE